MAVLDVTNAEVLRTLGRVIGVSRDAANDWGSDELQDARDVIRDGLRRFFNPAPFHQWNFLNRPFFAHGESSYSTGTIAATDGVVTLSGGTFPSWADDAVLRVNSQSYFVASRDSGTQVTVLEGGFDADASTTYALYRWRFSLPADYGEIIGGVTYNDGFSSRPLVNSTQQTLRLRYAVNFQTTWPQEYAIFPRDDADDSADWYFGVYPMVEDGNFASCTYRSSPADNLNASSLSDDGSVVQVDSVHAATLLAAIATAAEEHYLDLTGGPHSKDFDRLLAGSIDADRRAQGAPVVGASVEREPLLDIFGNVATRNDLI